MKKEVKNKNLDFSKFEKEISSLYSLLDANQKDEQDSDLRLLDEKVSQSLLNIGEDELANSISPVSELEAAEEPSEAKKSRFMIPTWFFTSIVGFATIILIGIGAVNWLFTPQINNDGTELATNRVINSPVLTLKPKNITDAGFIAQNNEFQLELDAEIDGDIAQLISISPEVDFEVEVEKTSTSTSVLILPKDDLQKDTEYTISIAEGLKLKDGTVIEKQTNWTLKVEPSFKVLSTLPENGDAAVSVDSPIVINLNQEIAITDLENAISLSPAVDGFIASEGSKYLFIPKNNLQYDQEYVVTIDAALESVGGGLGEEYSFTFNTEAAPASEKVLNWMETDSLIEIENQISATITNADDKISPVSSVRFTLYQLPLDQGTSFIIDNYDNLDVATVNVKSINSSTQTLREGVTYNFEVDEPGVYLLNAAVGPNSTQKLFINSGLTIIGEDMGDFTEAVVYDSETMIPVSDVKVNSYVDGASVGNSVTDASGRFTIKKGDVIVAQGKEDSAILSSQLTPSSFLLFDESKAKPYAGKILTDSQTYSQGDTVHFDIFAYNREDFTPVKNYEGRVLIAKSAQLKWYEIGTEEVLFDKNLQISDGWIEGSFTNNSNAEKLYLYAVVDRTLVTLREIQFGLDTETIQNSVKISKTFYFAGESIDVTLAGEGDAQIMLYRRELTGFSTISDASLPNIAFGELVDVVEIDLSEANTYEFTPLLREDSALGYIYTVALLSSDELSQPAYSSVTVYKDPYVISTHVSNTTPNEGQSVSIELKSKNLLDNATVPSSEFDLKVIRKTVEYDRKIVSSGYEIPISGDLYEAEIDFSIVLDKEAAKTDEKGLYKIELIDLEPGQYDLIISYGNSVNSVINAFEVPQIENELTMFGFGSLIDIIASNISSDSTRVALSIDEGDMAIVYGFDSGLFAHALSESSDSAQIRRAAKSLCIFSKSSEGEIHRSCFLGTL